MISRRSLLGGLLGAILAPLGLKPKAPNLPAVGEEVIHAVMGQAGASYTYNGGVVFGFTNLPLPIVHKDFNYVYRELEAAARRRGVVASLPTPTSSAIISGEE